MEEFVKAVEEDRLLPPVRAICSCGCGEALVSDGYTIEGKPVNADCWYAQIGEVVENHPLPGVKWGIRPSKLGG